MAPRYVDVGSFKKWYKTDKQLDDPMYEVEIEAAETDIDTALQRRVEKADPTTSTARVYRPTGCSSILVIDDAAEVVSVVENGTTLTLGTDYQLEPLNGLNDAGQTVPYGWLRRLGRNWYRDGDKATVTVTARWGWAAVPATIVSACMIVAADRLSNREYRNGVIAILETGAIGSRPNRSVAASFRDFEHPIKTLALA